MHPLPEPVLSYPMPIIGHLLASEEFSKLLTIYQHPLAKENQIDSDSLFFSQNGGRVRGCTFDIGNVYNKSSCKKQKTEVRQ